MVVCTYIYIQIITKTLILPSFRLKLKIAFPIKMIDFQQKIALAKQILILRFKVLFAISTQLTLF